MKWWDLLKTHPHFSTTPVGLVVIQFNYEAFSSVQEPWIKSKATKKQCEPFRGEIPDQFPQTWTLMPCLKKKKKN